MTEILQYLKSQFNHSFDVRLKRPGIWQVFLPFYQEDGDMLDIFLSYINFENKIIRISDFGMTVMKLSYSYELDTSNKRRLFNKILSENGLADNVLI